ncbi:NADH-quinone oxidoreductase subunit NuoE family protein [Candidatus Methylacidithermus pantelleriae]|uniref:NADH-quinone oxidoreductase subunit E n=1 Tax=Candidatus Methylacidithermus pantelleriae TaxID=2744239 RepID=A0A8J2FVB0_9BACT|nr:NAD(P)H-dependent oxidoreductase subunit E [Candidatus Methylacidithermus pantelleriae]CAF0691952.1 NADH-quinone oxidoreductase subunit E [Candidatus Methylacidithermus pantelleriae]
MKETVEQRNGVNAGTTFPQDWEERVEKVIAQFPVSKRSACLPLLHLWQSTFGYISEEGVQWIAARLGLEPIHVWELVTFYPMLRQEPVGKVHFKVCRTLSCALGGAGELYEYLRGRCRMGQPDEHGVCRSSDGVYSMEWVECLASCGTPPVMMVHDEFYDRVTTEKAEKILEKWATER